MAIDISSYQLTIDWGKVASSGVARAGIRATMGAHDVDSHFLVNVQGARDAGIQVWFYHYSYFSLNTAKEEFDHFWSIAGPYIQPGDVVPFLDFEKSPGLALPPLQVMIEWKAEWLGLCDAKIGTRAGFYSYRSILNQMYTHLYNDRPIWGSTISNTPPTPFEASRWSINQYGEGSVGGISGLVDVDRFLTPNLPAPTVPVIPFL